MIEIKNLHCDDDKAYDICVKHIHEHITSGIDYYIDQCDSNEEWLKDFQTDDCWKTCFPKGFTGDRLEELKRIRSLIESEEIVDLTMPEQYILMSCLRDYYDNEPQKYTLELAARNCALNGRYSEGIELNIQAIPNVEDRFHVLMAMMDTSLRTCEEAGEDIVDLSGDVEYSMSLVEDLSRYDDVCFEDVDYLLLADLTLEELLGHPAAPMMGFHA